MVKLFFKVHLLYLLCRCCVYSNRNYKLLNWLYDIVVIIEIIMSHVIGEANEFMLTATVIVQLHRMLKWDNFICFSMYKESRAGNLGY